MLECFLLYMISLLYRCKPKLNSKLVYHMHDERTQMNIFRFKWLQLVMGHDQKSTWIKCERHFMFHHLRKPLTPWMTIFPTFCRFEWKIRKHFVWFYVRFKELQDLGMNGISQFRTEVKHDSLKCKTLLSSVNLNSTTYHKIHKLQLLKLPLLTFCWYS